MREFEKPDHWDATAAQYRQTAHLFTEQFAKAALKHIPLTTESRVLDVAAGTGALALAAARTGAQVLATDFSPGMVACIDGEKVPNIETRVMDGQALDLPDRTFDAVFSIFGVMMFPDWRKGLSEMHRVTRPGGFGVVATWEERGAATFLLLGRVRAKLFPNREGMTMPDGVKALSDPAAFTEALREAGYRNPQVEKVTHDFMLDTADLAEPDKLFGMSPDWTELSDAEKAAVVADVRIQAGNRKTLPVPSTALIGVAIR